MALINDVFSITWGDLTVGGESSAYRLNGPYVIDKSHPRLRLVFDVVVVGEDHEQLQSLSDALETTFSKRDQSLEIDIAGSAWTYTAGSTILNSASSCQKSGNRDTDRGVSRAYTCIIEGELPATDQDGLRELEVRVDYSPSRQRTVSMTGLYTSHDGDTAVETYAGEFDARATALLATIDNAATWELVQEDHSQDRNVALCKFSRQYLELLANQSSGILDDTEIRDHRVSFTDLSHHPGDSSEGIFRLRRCHARYECAVDIEQTTNLDSVASDKVLPHVIGLFTSNYSPRVFGIEEMNVGIDRTGGRVSISATFVYQAPGGDDLLEVTQSVTTRETRTLDYTPAHTGSRTAAYVDAGWSVLELVYSRVAMVLGSQSDGGASRRRQSGGTDAARAVKSGWNIIHTTRTSTPHFIGHPEFGQIQVTIFSDTVVWRFNSYPSSGGGGPFIETPNLGHGPIVPNIEPHYGGHGSS